MSSAHINGDLRRSAEQMLVEEWEETKRTDVPDLLAVDSLFRRCGSTVSTHSLGDVMLEAARLDLLNVVTFCLKTVGLGYRNRLGDSALHLAARCGHTSLCRSLVQMGSSPNDGNRLGETPLMYASEHGHTDTVRFLVTCSDLSITNEFGMTALHVAARDGQESVCEVILKANRAVANWKDQNGQTALGYAGEQGFVDVMKIIEKYGGKTAGN